MSEQKKYAVITFLFNKYDLLREPLIVDEKADYYCITDDKDLKSENWTIIYVNEFDTDKLTGVQKTYMAKYSFYRLLPQEYGWYFTIDAAIQINDKLLPIINKMEEDGNDIGLSLHPERETWESEYKCWIYERNLDKKYYDNFKNIADEMGFDPKSKTGLIECTMKIYKNTKEVKKFIDDVYETLKRYNNFEDKNEQCYLTCIYSKYDSILNTLFFYRQLYTKSKYFSSYIHGTNKKWETDKSIHTNTNTLFGKKRILTEFGKIEYVNNIDIFIGTYKPFKVPVKNEVYKMIIGNHELENKSNLELINCKYDSPLDDKFFSELYMLKWISENYQLKEYVGYCHYRKYFNFLDDIPDMDKIFSEYDAIVGKPIIYDTRTIKQNYANYHNVEDLYIVGGIIADKYPSYCQMWHNFINGKVFIPYNMFIMKSEDFKKYCEFIFGVLNEYLSITGYDIFKRIVDNKDKYLKDFYPNNTIEYQYRIGGYIGERLTNVFILNNFKKMKTFPIVITEEKYKQ